MEAESSQWIAVPWDESPIAPGVFSLFAPHAGSNQRNTVVHLQVEPAGKLFSYLWLWLCTTLLQMLRRVCLVHSADERFDTSYHTDILVTPTGSCMYIPPGERSVCSLTCLQFERCLLVYQFIYKRVVACTQAINLATGESKRDRGLALKCMQDIKSFYKESLCSHDALIETTQTFHFLVLCIY